MTKTLAEIMIRILYIILSCTLLACTTYSTNKKLDKVKITKAVFQHALNEWEGCFDCTIKYIFLGSEEINISREFLANFNHEKLEFMSQEFASSSCETGLTYKGKENRGYAFSVFKIMPASGNQIEVEWGHWYSCKSYSYKTSKLAKKGHNWHVISTKSKGS